MTTRKRATLEEYLGAARRFQAGIITLIDKRITEEERRFRDEALGQTRMGALLEGRRAIECLTELRKSIFLYPLHVPDCFSEIGELPGEDRLGDRETTP